VQLIWIGKLSLDCTHPHNIYRSKAYRSASPISSSIHATHIKLSSIWSTSSGQTTTVASIWLTLSHALSRTTMQMWWLIMSDPSLALLHSHCLRIPWLLSRQARQELTALSLKCTWQLKSSLITVGFLSLKTHSRTFLIPVWCSRKLSLIKSNKNKSCPKAPKASRTNGGKSWTLARFLSSWGWETSSTCIATWLRQIWKTLFWWSKQWQILKM